MDLLVGLLCVLAIGLTHQPLHWLARQVRFAVPVKEALAADRPCGEPLGRSEHGQRTGVNTGCGLGMANSIVLGRMRVVWGLGNSCRRLAAQSARSDQTHGSGARAVRIARVNLMGGAVVRDRASRGRCKKLLVNSSLAIAQRSAAIALKSRSVWPSGRALGAA